MARPKKDPNERHDKVVMICLAERDRRRLGELAQVREASMSATVRSLIREAYEEEIGGAE